MSIEKELFKIKKIIVKEEYSPKQEYIGFLAPSFSTDSFEIKKGEYKFYTTNHVIEINQYNKGYISFSGTRIQNTLIKEELVKMISLAKEEYAMVQQVIETKEKLIKINEKKSVSHNKLTSLCGLVGIQEFNHSLEKNIKKKTSYEIQPNLLHSMIQGFSVKKKVDLGRDIDLCEYTFLQMAQNGELVVNQSNLKNDESFKEVILNHFKEYGVRVLGKDYVSELFSVQVEGVKDVSIVHSIKVAFSKPMELNRATLDYINNASLELLNEF